MPPRHVKTLPSLLKPSVMGRHLVQQRHARSTGQQRQPTRQTDLVINPMKLDSPDPL